MAEPILVVDDDAKIVRLVRTYLERDGFQVVTARDGRAALQAIQENRPRLVVLDLMLPELDGLALLRIVREDSDLPVLMLSARGSAADRVYGINEGADDYLAKPFSPAELVARVKSILRRSGVARGQPSRHDGRLVFLDLVIDLDRHEVMQSDRPVPLTAAEFRLLSALVRADGRVLTRELLLDALYGAAPADALDRTIDVHIGRLREKLGDDAERPRYIATVRGVGYRVVGPVSG
ncbi:MAG TPA: response regulator transcription factor [Candidatus Angelobacter sp.]|nr:response regulator transcription factor [Candidatus Angelobacter sp.]